MAITLDTIEKKAFKVVKNGGYDQMEVEDFLNEILDEMDSREKHTEQLEAQLKALTQELEQVRTQTSARVEASAKPVEARRSESFEKATEEAASLRATAEAQIADLTEKLAVLRKQAANYYASMKKAMDDQNASMEQIKKLL